MSSIISEFILGVDLKKIKEKVIIAPCWMPESVGINNLQLIGDYSCKIWNDGKLIRDYETRSLYSRRGLRSHLGDSRLDGIQDDNEPKTDHTQAQDTQARMDRAHQRP